MSNYTRSKGRTGADMDGQIESEWDRREPLITAEDLVPRFLFGIPLVSAIPDPETRKLSRMTPALIKEFIFDAVAEIESELKISIFPSQRKERLPFDRNEFESFGYFKLKERPIASIESLRIESPDGTNFFEVPNGQDDPNDPNAKNRGWIETGNMHDGQINILPLSPGMVNFSFATISGGGPAGLVFMSMLSGLNWIPAYWSCEYTVGYPNGSIPRPINNLIGLTVALNVLSILAATNAMISSASLGIDGMSQSVSRPGPNIFTVRIGELEKRRAAIISKLKAKYGRKFLIGNV